MNFQEKWRKLLLPLRYGGSGVDFKKLDPARSPFLQDRDRNHLFQFVPASGPQDAGASAGA